MDEFNPEELTLITPKNTVKNNKNEKETEQMSELNMDGLNVKVPKKQVEEEVEVVEENQTYDEEYEETEVDEDEAEAEDDGDDEYEDDKDVEEDEEDDDEEDEEYEEADDDEEEVEEDEEEFEADDDEVSEEADNYDDEEYEEDDVVGDEEIAQVIPEPEAVEQKVTKAQQKKPANSENVSKKRTKKDSDETAVEVADVDENAEEKQKRKTRRRTKLVTITGEKRVETEMEKSEREIIELFDYKYKREPLIAHLAGYEPSMEFGAIGVVYYKSTRILIPADKLVNLGTPEMIDDDGNELYRVSSNPNVPLKKKALYAQQRVERCLEMEMDYVIEDIKEFTDDNGEKITVVGGNRIEAMRIKRLNYFDDGINKAKIHIGDIVEARVVSVGAKQITVEVSGVETVIKAEELSYKHIANFTPEYEPGDLVLCKITDIQLGSKKDRNVVVEASVRQTNPDPRIDQLKHYKVGTTQVCKVAYISRHGIYATIGDDKDMEVYCHFPRWADRPILNDKVLVALENIDMEKFQLQGRIKKVLKTNR